ncbi:MAG: hypothetical protein ABUS49_06610, partial [Acidobacteriota bacterium]
MKVSFPGGLIAVWLCLSGCSQQLSGQTLDFRMRQGQPFPWQGTAYPEDQSIQVAAASGWTPKITGELLS